MAFVPNTVLTAEDLNAAFAEKANAADVVAALATKATPEDIQTAIDALLDSPPGALDTLNKIAAAIGDDANFAETVAAAIAAKQDQLVSGMNIKTLNGEALTGSGDIKIPSTAKVYYMGNL